ncbi:MAG: alpha/beta hydrolase, partial [Rikenellaceae bacterium]|nr:alpha/beta hydrolase [Rikenellaceae bacterium]
TENTPPSLIFVSSDDRLAPQSAIYFQALNAKKVSSALYIFPNGGHGWGFNADFKYHEEWKHLYLKWLKDIKIIE